jgi:hypothetical protein
MRRWCTRSETLKAGYFENFKERIFMLHSQLRLDGKREIFVKSIDIGEEKCSSEEAATWIRKVEELYIEEIKEINSRIQKIMVDRSDDGIAFQNQYFLHGALVVHVSFLSVLAQSMITDCNEQSLTVMADYQKCSRSMIFSMSAFKVKKALQKVWVI